MRHWSGALPAMNSPEAPPQVRELLLEASLLGPVALRHRMGEGERQRIAVIRRGKAALPHVVLALEQDGVRGVVAVIDRGEVGDKVAVVGQAARLAPFLHEA